ncbi:MAG: HD domain-containing protein [Prolixibacteraceae bacterium]|jgi:hypothetical protein|nr:HD domain-containing protein [Prolixibacteraceae bacterium]MBT6005748.1 HD domain-containing protein [Prolixibacteraceae bacterium]MBT6998144.1 HD domain-containing protein [Prolixibacteraceae bacterium]MBT7395686.1 HD domain-containing protein [Prolixibacteraceae bacterium]
MRIIDLPIEIIELLETLNSPLILKRHLTIVHATAFNLLARLKDEWPVINLKNELILFGAATHDIGKIKITNELFAAGKKHELAGMEILINQGYKKEKSRFAQTHGDWKVENREIEDLLVSLSDNIWKGKRIDDLEEMIILKLSAILESDYWEVYEKFDIILSEIATGADKRLNWQGQ